ncbi:TIGR02269 family lipoprotein [Hyalangium rubrum]|uniref:TIGR02269 family lipoprotein n=1 Tax=Hyalangium rubrum TaxID=3103134 RepID=A0ABU5GWL2_9BACT|nr:TIGR02269 family lipoprotein [Hyalangium sp. s54d21]MDY7225574.1 TIGR02269 family lipoprotein [Hyalangium sp. s54d21]
MSKLHRLWPLVCGALVACATTQPLVDEGGEASVPLLSFEEACGEEGSLLAVCGAEQCAVYRCRDVAEEPLSGRVVRARGTGFGRGSGLANRYWGSAQGPLKNTQAVFIIPWGPRSQQELSPGQKLLQEDTKTKRTQVYERHHIFPREFEEWFEERGIDIDQYTLPLEVEKHRDIHRGAQGGPWNAAWRRYVEKNQGALKPDVMKYAGQLIYEFELFGVVVPYRPRGIPPPAVGGY